MRSPDASPEEVAALLVAILCSHPEKDSAIPAPCTHWSDRRHLHRTAHPRPVRDGWLASARRSGS